jgi:large subunit ribosomal protein L16
MLMPKRVKWRKQMRGRMRGKALRGAQVSFGEYGLQALEPGWVTARQIEAARRAIVREMKRRGKVWIRIFPAKPYTHKPPETRMGSGKGNVEYYVAVVKPGRIMFEVGGMDESEALKALKMAQYKFSIRTKIVNRRDLVAGE